MANNINLIPQPASEIMAENFAEFEREFAEQRSAFFNCLTKEQQLLVFCEVVHKLVNAEINDRLSYRGVLYGEFDFDTDSYLKAQCSGFLELHNSIDPEPIDLAEFGSKLLKLYGIEQTKEEVEAKINKQYPTEEEEEGEQ